MEGKLKQPTVLVSRSAKEASIWVCDIYQETRGAQGSVWGLWEGVSALFYVLMASLQTHLFLTG